MLLVCGVNIPVDDLPGWMEAIGRAVHLRVQLTQRQPVVLVGTAAEDLGACRGAVDGLLTAPEGLRRLLAGTGYRARIRDSHLGAEEPDRSDQIGGDTQAADLPEDVPFRTPQPSDLQDG